MSTTINKTLLVALPALSLGGAPERSIDFVLVRIDLPYVRHLLKGMDAFKKLKGAYPNLGDVEHVRITDGRATWYKRRFPDGESAQPELALLLEEALDDADIESDAAFVVELPSDVSRQLEEKRSSGNCLLLWEDGVCWGATDYYTDERYESVNVYRDWLTRWIEELEASE